MLGVGGGKRRGALTCCHGCGTWRGGASGRAGEMAQAGGRRFEAGHPRQDAPCVTLSQAVLRCPAAGCCLSTWRKHLPRPALPHTTLQGLLLRAHGQRVAGAAAGCAGGVRGVPGRHPGHRQPGQHLALPGRCVPAHGAWWAQWVARMVGWWVGEWVGGRCARVCGEWGRLVWGRARSVVLRAARFAAACILPSKQPHPPCRPCLPSTATHQTHLAAPLSVAHPSNHPLLRTAPHIQPLTHVAPTPTPPQP